MYEQIIDVLGESEAQASARRKEGDILQYLADEARDISNQEQLALIIRFIDKEHKIKEECIVAIRDLIGESISKLILYELKCLGISMQNCRAQGYGGAGAMSGSKKGVVARITKLSPKIIFVHCFSHVLNCENNSNTSCERYVR